MHSNLPSRLFTSQIPLLFCFHQYTLSFLKPDYFSNMALFTKTKVFVKEAVFSLKKKNRKRENQVIKDEML